MLDDILTQNTDGLFGGNILEFKLAINDVNKVLFQTIKYLSRCRINGISISVNILLVSLNNRIAYKFNSQDFLLQIKTLYIGSASVNNKGFSTAIKPKIIKYKTTSGSMALIGLLRTQKSTLT